MASGKSSRDAAAAVHLDRAVDDAERDVRRGDLDRGDLGAGVLVADGVHQPGRLQREQPRHVDLDPRLGDPVLHVRPLGDGLTEGDPRRRPGGTSARARARPRRSPRMQWWMRPGPEAGLGDQEAVALLADQVRRRARGRPRTRSRRGPPGRCSRTPGRLRTIGHARACRAAPGSSTAGERSGASGSVLPITIRILQRSRMRAGDPPLAAVEHVVVAVALDPQLDVGGVRARHAGLGHRERRADLAVEQRRAASAPSARGCRTG